MRDGRAVGDGTAQLLSLVLAALLGASVLAAAWTRHRRSWRRRQLAALGWLRENGISAPVPRDPAAWRLVLTDDLGADGTFARDVRGPAPTPCAPAPARPPAPPS